MTAFGLLLLPVCLAAGLRPVLLLQLAVFTSVFEAAAALALGELGLQPAMLPSAMFSAFVLLQVLLGARYRGQDEIWRPLLPMTLFAAWALAGSFALPRVFAGQISVFPQKMEPPFGAVLLSPAITSVNQDLYLVVDYAVLLFTSLFTSGSIVRPLKILNAFILSGYAAVVIGLWQLANKLVGVPFPDSFFYSNPGWSILSGQQVSFVPRINGPFTEPSAYAGFMVSVVCSTGWMALNGRTPLSVRVLLCCALVMVLLSTSTTGYGVLAIFAVVLPVYVALRGSGRLHMQVARWGVILCLGLAGTSLTATALFPGVIKAADEVITSTLGKQDSASYRERSTADADSLEMAFQTYGLGVGWGVNRSSSLIPGILSTVGVVGAFGLVWFAVGLVRFVSRACRLMRDPDDLMVIRGATGAILGVLASALLSGPSITSISFYLLIGLMIGTSARVLAQAKAAYPAVSRRRQPGTFASGVR